MPAALVKKLAAEFGMSEKEAEAKWERAKELAARYQSLSKPRFYAVVMKIFKNLMHAEKVNGWRKVPKKSKK